MPSQIDRLEALIASLEIMVQSAFREFIRAVNSETVAAILSDLIERGDISGAMRVVDSYVERFADVLPIIQQTAGTAAAKELAETAGQFVLAIGFDPSHPRAAQMAAANRLELVQQFTSEQRRATRLALTDAFERGVGTAQTARAFRNSIGLHSQQVAWSLSYARKLRKLDPSVLGMDLRDRRFDRTVRAAIERGRALTETQIANMVERYRARALMYRSEMIARTEAIRATSMARHEALIQMIGQTGMDPRRIVRIWNSTRDARVRDHHATMDRQRVGLDEKFEDGLGNTIMWPGDPTAPPETTINCRCTVTYEIKPPLQDFSTSDRTPGVFA